MTREHRTAMARIISDMIKADNIIEESEIRDMKKLMSGYSITHQEMSDARKIRFSDAVNTLKELPIRERKAFFDHIYSIALSDNICVPREALLLIALQYCLIEDNKKTDGTTPSKPYLISCPTGEASFNDQYMVYLESSYDEERNEELKQHFRLLVTITRLCGFNFIYIPKMVEEFRGMNKQYVKDVISYMAPNIEETSIQQVYDRLCDMTTVDFFRNVLYERLQVKALHNTPPSLLINIGTSVVPYCSAGGSIQYYTEFLCIPISSNILTLVDDILGFYQSKVSIRQSITISDSKGQFKYFGFYKALFDFLVAPPPVAPDLIFLGQDMKTGRYQVAFKFDDGNEKKICLTPQQYDIYFQVALRTYKSRLKGLSVSYCNNIKPSIAKIKSIISGEIPDLTYSDQYKPERDGNAYVLRLDKSKIFVRVRTSNCGCDYEDIPIVKYDKK
ncbi:MAG: hypothetical protein J5671_03985 [Bacteroidaceae bacterium]|nr:hypothetical protein [Bacteroidaceae bacterium]